jgi:RNA polymerase sigma factor (sigma-70 family)
VTSSLPVDTPPTAYEELLPLAARLARGLWRVYRVCEYQDVYQDACLGLVRAVQTFDPNRGVPLEAYARRVIAGAILNGIRARDPLSEHARKLLREAERNRTRMRAEGRAEPTLRELSTHISGLGAALLMAHRASTVSLDAPLPEGERLPADVEADPARLLEHRERAERVRRAIASLTQRQRAVVELAYYADETVTSVGEKLHISAQRVAQLRDRALVKMRKALVEA